MHKGDFCVAQANSQELRAWGLTTGFTSYSAAYATGLLCSRRILKKYKLDSMFKGVGAVDGTDYDVSADAEAIKQDKRPFKAILDIGSTKASTGNRVFGVLKGACDGGLHVPHSVRKYPGYIKEEDSKKGVYNAELHKERIFGCHIDEYMEKLKEQSEVLYLFQIFYIWVDNCSNKESCRCLLKSVNMITIIYAWADYF